jgi:hypothetical protein
MATLASDTSDTAVAAFWIHGLPQFEMVSELSAEEQTYSSSRRELIAFSRVLALHGELLSSEGPVTIWWITDNSNVAKFLSKGSGVRKIMIQILDIFRLSRKIGLDIRPIWVRHDSPFLVHANGLSKSVDTDGWSVWQGDFDFLAAQFGPSTIHLFASAEKAKVEQLYSFSFEKGCSGVDAFAFEWVGEMVYMAPPVSLVSRCIRKIAYEGAHEGEYISSIQMCI